MSNFTFTSESVTEGHPDKMADQVSDAVLDAILAEDPNGRVACETLLTTGLCVVAGEITTSAYVDIPKLAREVINSIGYDNALYGFDGNTCGVIVSIDEQSADIAQGVDKSEELRSVGASEDKIDDPGRRRPGDDVRLRLRRDARPDAAADLAGPPHERAPVRGAQGRRRAVPAARRQDPGHDRLRERQAGAPVARADLDPAPGRHRPRHGHPPGPDRARHPPGRAGRSSPTTTTTCTSTRPASSSSVARTATPASPVARSSSTPTAAWVATAVARSAARTRRRSTARRPTRPGGWPSTSSPPARRRAARCRWPTPSAWRTR